MIHDLDRTIQALLEDETQGLPPSIRAQVTITFATPDDEFPPAAVTLPAIDFFLYDISENRELRTNEPVTVRANDGTVTRQRPPVRVDCAYLVTAWAPETSPHYWLDEHQLLGETLLTLSRNATIDEPFLRGALAGQQPPLPVTALQPGRPQSASELWQALGGKPRAAFSYVVTIGVQPFAASPTAPPPDTFELELRRETFDFKPSRTPTPAGSSADRMEE